MQGFYARQIQSELNSLRGGSFLFLVGFLLRGGGQHLLIQPHVPSLLLCLTAGQATLRSFHFKSEVIPCCAGQSFRFRLLVDFKSTQLFFHSNSPPSSFFQNISVDIKFVFVFFITVPSYHNDITLRSFHLKSEVVEFLNHAIPFLF